jgi:hypothetical protein
MENLVFVDKLEIGEIIDVRVLARKFLLSTGILTWLGDGHTAVPVFCSVGYVDGNFLTARVDFFRGGKFCQVCTAR